MDLNRRGFLQTVGAGAAAVALGACAADGGESGGEAIGSTKPASADSRTALPPVTETAVAHFTDLGYSVLPPLSLITSESFNGGIRYDASPESEIQEGLRVQPCARLDDIGNNRPDSPALFHQIDIRNNIDGLANEESLTVALDFVLETLGLDPTRVGFVSTDLMAPFVPLVAARGVPEDQVVFRQVDEAVAAGDGSGYFNPQGHPWESSPYTTSLHWRIDPNSTAALGYPTGPEWTEIGEMQLNVGPQADSPLMGWAFGLERLDLARDGTKQAYDERRLTAGESTAVLLEALEAEAAQGAELPPGFKAFESEGT